MRWTSGWMSIRSFQNSASIKSHTSNRMSTVSVCVKNEHSAHIARDPSKMLRIWNATTITTPTAAVSSQQHQAKQRKKGTNENKINSKDKKNTQIDSVFSAYNHRHITHSHMNLKFSFPSHRDCVRVCAPYEQYEPPCVSIVWSHEYMLDVNQNSRTTIERVEYVRRVKRTREWDTKRIKRKQTAI